MHQLKMSCQGEKSVEEITQMFNKLNELGLLEKMLEEARLKKEEHPKKDDNKKEEINEEKPKDDLSSVLKIEKWTGEKGAVTKTLMLISKEDYSKMYGAVETLEFVCHVLEKNDQELHDKPVILSKEFYGGLSDQLLIEIGSPENLRTVKVEADALQLFTKIGTPILVNKISNTLIRTVLESDKDTNRLCLVKATDLEKFPYFEPTVSQNEDIPFLAIDSWFYGYVTIDNVVMSHVRAKKVPIYKSIHCEKSETIGIMSAIEISKKECIVTEKYVLVSSCNVRKDSPTYNIVKRVSSPAVESMYDVVVNNARNSASYLPNHKLQDGSDIMLTMMLRDESTYNATHMDVVINKPVYDSLNVITSKNRELHATDFNRIYHLSLAVSSATANPLIPMLITAGQYNQIVDNLKMYVGACFIAFLRREDNNMTEEFVLTHTSWRDARGNSGVVPLKMLDANDKSKWSTKYMRKCDFDLDAKEKSTFDRQPATFMNIMIDGSMCNCLVTNDQLANITMA